MAGPEQPTSFELAAAAERLELAMAALRDDLQAVRRYGLRNRAMIWAIGILGAVVAVVVVVATVAAVRAGHAAHKANEATSATAQLALQQRTSCEAGNDSRRLNRNLWNYVLSEAVKSNPAGATQIEQFRAYIAKTFADRDCSVVAPIPGPTAAPSPSAAP